MNAIKTVGAVVLIGIGIAIGIFLGVPATLGDVLKPLNSIDLPWFIVAVATVVPIAGGVQLLKSRTPRVRKSAPSKP